MRCWKRRNGTYDAPCATTFWELFNHIDTNELDQEVCKALRILQGNRPEAIAVDGKTVRSTRADETHENPLILFAALAHDQAIVQNPVAIADKSNEIPALPELPAPLELDGTVVTADALNTQCESARPIVQEKGGDSLFTVKDNQPSLRKRIEKRLSESSKRAKRPAKAFRK